MEIIYTVDIKMAHNGEEFKHILTMDISSLNILAFSSSYLSSINQLKYSPHIISS